MTPLAYLAIDGKMIIVGSYAGADIHPAWVHNLRANPARTHRGGYRPNTTSSLTNCRSSERDEIYPKVIAIAPGFAEYQAKTSRIIPLFELVRA